MGVIGMDRVGVIKISEGMGLNKIANKIYELKKQGTVIDYDILVIPMMGFLGICDSRAKRPKVTEENNKLYYIFLKALNIACGEETSYDELFRRIGIEMDKFLKDNEYILIAYDGRIIIVLFYIKSNDEEILSKVIKTTSHIG